MTLSAVLPAPALPAAPRPDPPPLEAAHPGLARSPAVLPLVGLGLVLTGAAGVIAVLFPAHAGLALAVVCGMPVLVGAVALLLRRPEYAPWGAIVLFPASAELQLRVSPVIGLVKDGYVGLLLAVLLVELVRRRAALRRLRALRFPLAAGGLLVALYLADPAGSHGTQWLFGTRLLLEVVALLLIGLLLAPERSLPHLVRAVTVMLPFEAAFAWVQQAAGPTALVYQWGYQYGAQMRVTSGGGLRTSGTFEDPFQLAALGILGLALALFVASRRQAVVLVVSAVAVLGATQVRTALIQAGILVVLFALRRGWWRQAAALGAVSALAGVLFLATTTTAVYPGAPQEPLLLTLNGRSTAWSLAVDGWESLITGNGVGARGIGSTRTSTSLSPPPTYDGQAPNAYFAGDPAFLDSAYAQVQSDVGIVGSAALLAVIGGLGVAVARRCRDVSDGTAWAAGAVLAVTAVDWIGRSSLASYTTGFLTLYVLGVLLGAGRLGKDAR